jgi:hypothetical protein
VSNIVWLIAGGIAGLVLAAAIGVVAVNLILPWDDICATFPHLQRVAEVGSKLLVNLQAWLTQAQDFLSLRPLTSTEEARTGLSGLLDQAADVGVNVARTTLNVVTAPLQALIALTKEVLAAVQAAVDAARDAIDAIDAARCE